MREPSSKTQAHLREWGIPNWRDSTSYGDVKGWDFRRWRWEFFRRNKRLREYFDKNAQKTHEMNVDRYSSEWARQQGTKPEIILRPDQPGFCAISSMQAAEEFGFNGIPNPRISDQPEWALTPRVSGIEIYPGEDLPIDQPFAIHCPEGKVAIVFDLNEPIPSQLKSAKEALKAYASRKVPTKRKHPNKWFTYLRALDARESGATYAEILSVLLDENSLTQDLTSARDLVAQAKKLSSNF